MYIFISYIIVIILYSIYRSTKKSHSKAKQKGPDFPDDKVAVKISKVLDSMNFDYKMITQKTEKIVFTFDMRTNHIYTQCYIVMDPDEMYTTLIIQNPVLIPEAKRMRVFEFLGMINYDSQLGQFKMNNENGVIRLNSGLTFEFIREESVENIAKWFQSSFDLMDQIFPGLMAVGYGNVLPAEMYDRLNGTVDARLN